MPGPFEHPSVERELRDLRTRLEALERVTGGGGIDFDKDNQGGSLIVTTLTGNIDLNAGEEQVNAYAGEVGLYSKIFPGSTGDVGLYSERDIGLYSDRDVAANGNRDAYLGAGVQGTLGGDVVVEARGGSYADGRVTLLAAEMVVLNAGLSMRVEVDASGVLTVFTSGGTEPLFRIDADGSLHGKTGQALTFDL